MILIVSLFTVLYLSTCLFAPLSIRQPDCQPTCFLFANLHDRSNLCSVVRLCKTVLQYFCITEPICKPACLLDKLFVKVYNHRLINYKGPKTKFHHLKKFTCTGTLRQVSIRVYRLEILSVMLVFSTQLCELLPL
jgi:hypothetical protein